MLKDWSISNFEYNFFSDRIYFEISILKNVFLFHGGVPPRFFQLLFADWSYKYITDLVRMVLTWGGTFPFIIKNHSVISIKLTRKMKLLFKNNWAVNLCEILWNTLTKSHHQLFLKVPIYIDNSSSFFYLLSWWNERYKIYPPEIILCNVSSVWGMGVTKVRLDNSSKIRKSLHRLLKNLTVASQLV